MKVKFWGIAALPLLALLATSCAEENVELKDDSGKVIAFKAATGKQTLSRASEYNIGTLQSDQLEIRSYKNGDASLYNTFEINYDGSAWTYGSTPVFHPTFGLTHYSVYPVTGITPSVSNDGGIAVESFDYTVADTDALQKDLMIARATTSNTNQAAATATLVYKHVLSQVNFAIQGKEGLKVAISNIKVKGVNNSGTYDFGTSGWSSLSGSVGYDYNPVSGTTSTTGISDDEIVYMGNTGDIATGADNDNDNALMLMPQSFADGDGAGFTFDYSLTNMDGTFVDSDTDVMVEFGDLGVTEWQMGKRYLYKIVFDPVMIKFNVTVVEAWLDYDDTVYGVVDVDMNN